MFVRHFTIVEDPATGSANGALGAYLVKHQALTVTKPTTHIVSEQGGEMGLGNPAGYWVDFTEIAQALSWQRLPALPTWQSAFFAARFNEFVIPADKSWQGAMNDLYPAEYLVTPTPILPPTLTPTRTPSWPPAP